MRTILVYFDLIVNRIIQKITSKLFFELLSYNDCFFEFSKILELKLKNFCNNFESNLESTKMMITDSELDL